MLAPVGDVPLRDEEAEEEGDVAAEVAISDMILTVVDDVEAEGEGEGERTVLPRLPSGAPPAAEPVAPVVVADPARPLSPTPRVDPDVSAASRAASAIPDASLDHDEPRSLELGNSRFVAKTRSWVLAGCSRGIRGRCCAATDCRRGTHGHCPRLRGVRQLDSDRRGTSWGS